MGIIDTALAQNLDLRMALQRVEQARANWLERRAPLLPTVNGVAAAGLDHYGDYTLNGWVTSTPTSPRILKASVVFLLPSPPTTSWACGLPGS
ncbi:TolC family protein [Hymenobacter sp. AT01-02]|uniref:TolC family protein n=1 Tax=Hymenobacter sp. AT01-02 TaxID=1571877 RepID=UPI002934B75E|nr:TolC family protein [Hymenobacter sp. AT01-02]